ncbi:hypothetical protein KFO32_05560 [Pantoea ananatis]|uniref:hypothetical protein n=1 Tax=Pantoea ananas TaxID=553 RepID=UPI001FF2B6D4|nr:hypothetical protein [Pantoea ananatis]MCK0552543.1 hypothetical protein [Pantoea ananatis]
MDNAQNAQATPDGVLDKGKVTGYSVIIRALNDGEHDTNTVKGLRLLACVWEAVENGWYRLSAAREIIIWRWLVVAVFITQEKDKNGTADVPNDEGGIDRAVIYRGANGGMAIYPGPERFALANHVESIAIEKYGTEKGLSLAMGMYKNMLTNEPKQGFRLSEFGQQAFEMLHDSFIEELNKNGVPDAPVMH